MFSEKVINRFKRLMAKNPADANRLCFQCDSDDVPFGKEMATSRALRQTIAHEVIRKFQRTQ